MLSKLRAMLFDESTKDTKPPAQDPGKCLVKIRLAGEMHTFYQDISFVESLTKAMAWKTLTAGGAGFLEFKTPKGSGYSINLGCINYVEICEDVYEIKSAEAPGYSIYLKGEEYPFKLGELPAEQVDINLVDQGIRFLRLGNHYFKRDEVILICALK